MNIENYDYKNYWNKNVKEWGDLYLQISHGHESFNCSKLMSIFYNKFITPYEAKLMKIRYQKTMEFIDKYVRQGTIVSDIGCGTGIFTVHCLKKGAVVNVVDISESAIQLTQEQINHQVPDQQKNVNYYLLDAQKNKLPASDVSIAVGVLPYISDVDSFFSNVFSTTDLLYYQFSSSFRPANLLRKYCRFLNVRRLQFQSKGMCEKISKQHGFDMINCERFATGYLAISKRQSAIKQQES